MGYEIMYKKVFLKATDEMGVDLYTPVCLIGPNNFMSEDIRMPSRKPRGHEKVLIKEGKRYVENIEYKNEAGKNIPNRVCMTSDVKDAKEFTFEEAAAIQNDFSMVFPSLKKTRLVSTKIQSKPFDAIIAFEDVDGTEKFVAKNTRSRLFVALDEEGAKRYADKSSAQKVCAALNEKRYSRSVKNGSFRVKFLIPC